MTDSQFKKVIEHTAAAKSKHGDLLKLAEEEYERRFGFNPSEVDDDFWIDSLHYGNGSIDFKDILAAAKLASSRAKR